MRGTHPYKPGQHLAICDLCGLRFLSGKLRKDYRGLMVCKADYEQRHPQESLKAGKDRIKVDNPRPQGQDRFLQPGEVTPDDL
jgi:hypothetical protein